MFDRRYAIAFQNKVSDMRQKKLKCKKKNEEMVYSKSK